MNIIILGPQGSGKGTQAGLLAKRLGLDYFESGGFFRELAKINKKVDEFINKKGKLLPDDEVFSYITKYLEENFSGFDNLLLDGYPRSVRQYELLKGWLQTKKEKIDLAIFLDISEAESIRRLSSRRICERCGRIYNLVTSPPPGAACECGGNLIQREDDRPAAIKTRLKLYEEDTTPMLKVLQKEGILVKVNGERPIREILTDILHRVKTRDVKK